MDSEATAGAITGLKAEVIDQEIALPDGRIAWSRRWYLCWDAVPGAAAYAVTAVTPEGSGEPGDTTDRCLAMTIASGIAERRDSSRLFDPTQQLMLSLIVAARFADGTLGPASPALPIGRIYPARFR